MVCHEKSDRNGVLVSAGEDAALSETAMLPANIGVLVPTYHSLLPQGLPPANDEDDGGETHDTASDASVPSAHSPTMPLCTAVFGHSRVQLVHSLLWALVHALLSYCPFAHDRHAAQNLGPSGSLHVALSKNPGGQLASCAFFHGLQHSFLQA
jgi:hypothetical protein